jgi:GTP cyclohydrolase II
MLLAMDVQDVQLITNNPEKIEQLERYGIAPRSVRPTKMHLNPYNQAYLHAKAELARHHLAGSGLGVAG